jgi:peptidoglycan/xylan/chitin deacetylase (PgdA/CDA1 family)
MLRIVDSAVLRVLGSVVSPGGALGRLSILIYHRVHGMSDPLLPGEVDAAAFSTQMALLAEHFRVLQLEEAVERLARGQLPTRAVSVTFDDGYADNHDVAMPILRRFGIPATFFIATGFLDGGRMWNDTVIEAIRQANDPALDLSGLGLGTFPVASISERRIAIHSILNSIKHKFPSERDEIVGAIAAQVGAPMPSTLMMTRDQVRALRAAGMGIGGHTVNHPILTRIVAPAAEHEIADGKAELEAIIGEPVGLFAYPNGKPTVDFGAEHVALTKKLGFRAAVTTSWGAARQTSDLFQLPRFTPWDRQTLKFGLRLLLNARRSGYEI